MSRFREEIKRLHDRQYRKDFLYNIIFESDTPEGKVFDIILMIMIALSVIIAIFGSTFKAPWLKTTTTVLEYVFTVFFTAEYVLRIYCSPNPRKYMLSFFGIVDLLAISPMYVGVLLPTVRSAIILRSLRLMRIFRVMKLFNFLTEGNILLRSIMASAKKIAVFFLFVVLLVICLGTMMFMVEGNNPGTSFNNVPNSIYWAVVTLTTVGYGDITPVTTLGKFLATTIMLLGYTVLAIPTGIISASMIRDGRKDINRRCSNCGRTDHDADAQYCKYCGAKFEDDVNDFKV
ncbi:MAG: ion transporter [Bacteroidales bacterium]|nr:ion transporter [Bacteroidales bacterium]